MRDKLIKQLEELQSKQMQLRTEMAEITKTKASISAQITEAWIQKQNGILCDPTWLKGAHFKKQMLSVRMQEINTELQNLAAQKRSINLQVHDIQQKSLVERIILLIFKPGKR